MFSDPLVRIVQASLFLLTTCLLAACAHPGRVGIPKNLGAALTEAASKNIVSTIAVGASSGTLRALYRAEISVRGRKGSQRYAVVYDGAGNLRLDILPTQGAYALGVFVARGSQSVFLDNTEKRAYRGNNDRALIERFFHLPLSSADLIAVLERRLPESLAKRLVAARCWQNEAEIICAPNDFGILVAVSEGALLNRLELRDKSGEVIEFKAEYRPTGIRVALPESRALVDLTEQIRKSPQAIDRGLFEVAIPGDFVVSGS